MFVGNRCMNTTSITLLQQLRERPDSQVWSRFVLLYTPLLTTWARKRGLNDHDAADLVQDVLMQLVRKLPEFQYQPGRSFRGWMRMVLINKWRDRRRHATTPLESDIQPEAPEEDGLEEREYRLYLLGRALHLMQADFEHRTWQACWETIVMSRPASDVADELQMTVNAVYLAKTRVLNRLRQVLDGLLD